MSKPKITLDTIRDGTHEVVYLGARGSGFLGGPEGARDYLNDTLVYWLGLAIAQEGMAGACQLMDGAWRAAAHIDRCDHGRCAS